MLAVEVTDLRIELVHGKADIVDEINFELSAGEVLGLVGESGSGKTTVGLALLGHARPGARIADGRVLLGGHDVLAANENELRDLRGAVVSYIAQDPAAALNPALRLRRQLIEVLDAHRPGTSRGEREQRMREVLDEVELPDHDDFLSRYPHQISGGQQQRLAIGIAFACRPKVIVCDEPTTGLDVTTQAKVLETVRQLCASHGVAAVYVSHDLGVVAELADRVLVMYAGRLSEVGARETVFGRPAHPYTRRLLSAIPSLEERLVLEPIPGRAPAPGDRPSGCYFAPRCSLAVEECTTAAPAPVEVEPGHLARCIRATELVSDAGHRLTAELPTRSNRSAPVLEVADLSASYGAHRVLHDVSFSLQPRECLALVGESGSGKTTLSRAIIGLIEPDSGTMMFEGEPLAGPAARRPAEARRRLQYVFQSPFNSLNPRRPIGASVAAPLEQFFQAKGSEARRRVQLAFERVSLAPSLVDHYPDQLSGGERQRVAIARSLICEPRVLICDEVTSALDVSVQASIIALLERLRQEDELSLLFVTHNLPLVRSFADRVAVMNRGRIVETGAVDSVLDAPQDEYTRTLIADTPDPVAAA